MARKQVSSGLWSAEQEAMNVEPSNPKPGHGINGVVLDPVRMPALDLGKGAFEASVAERTHRAGRAVLDQGRIFRTDDPATQRNRVVDSESAHFAARLAARFRVP